MTHDPEGIRLQRRGRHITVASILFFLTGLLLPIFASYAVLYVMETQRLPIVFGIQSFGGGFIEGLGPEAFVVSGLVFIVVSALEIVAGFLLWKSLKLGGKLAIVLLPAGIFFWVGFLLPGPMLIGLLRLLLIGSEWKTLR